MPHDRLIFNRHQTKKCGDAYERKALDYLRAQGLLLLSKNYRCRLGEVDLVMREGPGCGPHNGTIGCGTLVFVEVRYRTINPKLNISKFNQSEPVQQRTMVGAVESVGLGKQRRLILAAQNFLQKNAQYATRPCRFDVIAFSQKKMDWIKNAFSLE